jgi:hypothetical protein
MKNIIIKDIAKKIWKYLSWDLIEVLNKIKNDLVKGHAIAYGPYREFLIAEEIWKTLPQDNRMQQHKQLSYILNKACNLRMLDDSGILIHYLSLLLYDLS